MKFLNVNIFEKDSEKNSKILKIIETTEKIYDFDKFNFNNLMTNIQNIKVKLFEDFVNQMKNAN